jgi:hypothetical protein
MRLLFIITKEERGLLLVIALLLVFALIDWLEQRSTK